MLTTTKCREQEMNIFQNSSIFFFPNKGTHGVAEQTPAQQEPVAPTVTLPAVVQGLTRGHRAQKGHSFALSLTQSP